VGAHLVPNAHQTYDIGATGLAFRDLYLKGSTIHLGNQTISTDGTGVFFNNSPLLNLKMYIYELDGASPITITPPSNCIAARITMSGGGGGGGNGGDATGGGGGAAGACSIHMVPFVGATACTLTLGGRGPYASIEQGDGGSGGGGGGGETAYSFEINSTPYVISCGGGGGGWGNANGENGGGRGTNGTGGTEGGVATHGTTFTPFGGYIEYNTPLLAGNATSGDGGDNASGTPGMINPLGGYGGAGAAAGGTAGAGGFAIFEWIYR
jgi:hypothetical protein